MVAVGPTTTVRLRPSIGWPFSPRSRARGPRRGLAIQCPLAGHPPPGCDRLRFARPGFRKSIGLSGSLDHRLPARFSGISVRHKPTHLRNPGLAAVVTALLLLFRPGGNRAE